MVLLYEPVAKRLRSGHDDMHNTPESFLKDLMLIENGIREMQ